MVKRDYAAPFCVSGGPKRDRFLVQGVPVTQAALVSRLKKAGHDASRHCRKKDRVVVVPHGVSVASSHKRAGRKVVHFSDDMLCPRHSHAQTMSK